MRLRFAGSIFHFGWLCADTASTSKLAEPGETRLPDVESTHEHRGERQLIAEALFDIMAPQRDNARFLNRDTAGGRARAVMWIRFFYALSLQTITSRQSLRAV
jgi:hypothetical protein